MIRVEHSHLPVHALTHPGMSGKQNEDRYAISAYRLNEANPIPVLLAVVADGIGGHRAGEVAAEYAVNRISQIIAASDGSDPPGILRSAIETASGEIYRMAQADADRLGMGSTWVCAWIIGNRVFTATVGDSRLYLLRRGRIQQLSTDHTWVQEALEKGILQPDQVRGHPNIHVIRRYLGSATPPEVDFRLRLSDKETDAQSVANQGLELQPGDMLFLCTDGLTDLVTNAEIQQAFRTLPCQAALQYLVDLANHRGGHDNITLLSVCVPERPRPRRRWLWLLAFLAVAALAIATGILLAQNSGSLFGTPGTPAPSPTATLPFVTQTPPPAISPTLQASPPVAETAYPAPPTAPPPTQAYPAPTGGATLTPWPTNTESLGGG